MTAPIAARRPRRRTTVLVVAFALLVVVLVVVDLVASSRAADAVAEEVATELGVPVTARVSGPLAGFRSLLGDLPVVELAAQGVAVPGTDAVISDLQVRVTGLQVEDRRPVAGAGTFTAAFDESQVRSAAPEGVADLVVLQPGALVLDLGLATVELTPRVRGDVLVLEPPGGNPLLDQVVGSATEVPLDVPDGVVVTDAGVVDGALVLSGTLDPVVVAG